MKVIINPEYNHLASFIKDIPTTFQTEGKSIHKVRNELKEYNIEGKNIIVKSFKKPIFINRMIYTFFRPSKAKRSYEYALILEKKNIGTPKPIAYIEQYTAGLLSKSYFISEKSDFPFHFEDLSKIEFENKEEILKAYAGFVAQMHAEKVLHKDLSKGNVLMKNEYNNIQFEIVDINRMEFGHIGFKKGCKNFERTIGDDESLRKIAACYARNRGFDELKTIGLVLHYRNNFFEKKNSNKETGIKYRKR